MKFVLIYFRLSLSFAAILVPSTINEIISNGEINNYALNTTTEIIRAMGYEAETHFVTTDDGYILQLHRIPYGKDGPSPYKRPIAFLQHCLLCSSSDWVMDKPDRALAYLLADAGYDVWMNNARGNTYSRNHTILDPEKRKFWQFTWDEHALYDVPAAIDYTLNVTGNAQVYYVGFSMGSTVFFALMSEKQEYKDKIKVAALMGPVAYVEHVKGPLKFFANYSNNIDLVLTALGHTEILASGPVMNYLAQKFCSINDVTAPLCYSIIFVICGFDSSELNKEYLSTILSHTPAGESFHTVNHYLQLITSGTFQKYDYGLIGNYQHYGQSTPPFYNLKVDTPPIGLYWGQNDWLATPQDVARLSSELVNVVVNKPIEHSKWNHIDFVWAIHAKEFVYDDVIAFLSDY